MFSNSLHLALWTQYSKITVPFFTQLNKWVHFSHGKFLTVYLMHNYGLFPWILGLGLVYASLNLSQISDSTQYLNVLEHKNLCRKEMGLGFKSSWSFLFTDSSATPCIKARKGLTVCTHTTQHMPNNVVNMILPCRIPQSFAMSISLCIYIYHEQWWHIFPYVSII